MSRHYIAINAVPLKLTAYATSGLPVTYKVLSGSSIITITQSGDFYYINPVNLGYATIVAYQTGDTNFRPALPIAKLVRVIGLPNELAVDAKILTIPDDLISITVDVLEPPVAPTATIDTTPLEPTKVKVSDQTPKSPIFVKTSYAPDQPTNTVAYDYDNRPAGYPNGKPFVISANIVEPANQPAWIFANQLATPSLLYANNLTKFVNVQDIEFSATVDTQGLQAEDLWDSNNSGTATLRNMYLTTSLDSHGLTYNPLWKFSSRPSLDQTNFYYKNENESYCDGKYQKEASGTTVYDIRWREVGKVNPKYIHFVSLTMNSFVIDTNALESNDNVLIGANVFEDLENKLYQNGHIGLLNFNNWIEQEIYENYVPDTIYRIGESVNVGAYVFSYDANPIKRLQVYSITPFAGNYDEFNNNVDRYKHVMTNLPEKAQKSLNIYYEKCAGDVLGAYNAWDINFEKNHWSPSMPVPFVESYVNSHQNFGVNPYAIVGEGISVYSADKNTNPYEPINVNLTEVV